MNKKNFIERSRHFNDSMNQKIGLAMWRNSTSYKYYAKTRKEK